VGIASKEQLLPFPSNNSQSEWMLQAFRLAEKAFSEGEVPVGSIVVKNNRIIGRGYNQRERLKDPTAHAEIIAITAASATLDDWRLEGSTLYVTKEPCPMCAGAIINSRISHLVFGAYDEKKGCCGSLYQLCGDKRLDSRTAVTGGIEEAQCAGILKEFFSSKRN
jgi:tRNA(adenine34) deaminase|tara:strand:+ start:214 stop:708 length:495 start_codon:yes stop_codon:yes gene_type:complete